MAESLLSPPSDSKFSSQKQELLMEFYKINWDEMYW